MNSLPHIHKVFNKFHETARCIERVKNSVIEISKTNEKMPINADKTTKCYAKSYSKNLKIDAIF